MKESLLKISTLALLVMSVLASTLGTYQFYRYLNPQKELNHYIDYLQDQAAKRGHSVNFRVIGIEIVEQIPVGIPGVIGLCYINPVTMQRSVFLLLGFWKRATESAKKSLLLHELGHCYYLLEHTEEGNSVMAPSMDYMTTLTKEQLDEFFKVAYP